MKTLLLPVMSVYRNWRNRPALLRDLALYHEQYEPDSIQGRRFYNIGPGEFAHPLWTNVDGSDEYRALYGTGKGPHIYINLFDHTPLPVEDHTAEIVYTSHTIEHVDDAAVNFLFREVSRILKPGGIFRVITPDTELAYRAWQRNDRRFYGWLYEPAHMARSEQYLLNIPYDQATLAQVFLEEFAAQASTITTVGAEKRISDEELTELFKTRTLEEAFDYCTSFCSIEIQKQHPWRHMNWFHENKLRKMLESAGFRTVYRSAYLQSVAPVLREKMWFDQTLPQHSLFMEAVG
jgi:predicted SAM-dependent methyltransferase